MAIVSDSVSIDPYRPGECWLVAKGTKLQALMLMESSQDRFFCFDVYSITSRHSVNME